MNIFFLLLQVFTELSNQSFCSSTCCLSIFRGQPYIQVGFKLILKQRKIYIRTFKRLMNVCSSHSLVVCCRGATSSSFRGGDNFHELSFDDVIVLFQPWYNVFANGHIYVIFATFLKMRTY